MNSYNANVSLGFPCPPPAPNEPAETAVTPPEPQRCLFRHPSGRRCRLLATPFSAPFCPEHASFVPDDPDSLDIAPTLLGNLTAVTDPYEMQQVLSRLFILVAQNRVSTKKAASLTYIIQQLIQTLPAVQRIEEMGPITYLSDPPRPLRD